MRVHTIRVPTTLEVEILAGSAEEALAQVALSLRQSKNLQAPLTLLTSPFPGALAEASLWVTGEAELRSSKQWSP